MRRAPYVCFAIVAVFPLHLAAATLAIEDVPITPPVAAAALRLGIDPASDPAGFMAEMARALFGQGGRASSLTSRVASVRAADPIAKIAVPVPLPASVWSRAVFRRTVPPDQLILTILSDRRAALLCRGLAGLDDETLEYLAERPLLVNVIYERAAAPFAAFGDSLRVRDGRIVPPGGDAAAPLWEAVVGAPLAAPDEFVRLLFAENSGRTAYLYDALSAAHPRAAAFALGLWIADAAERARRFQALGAAVLEAYREWRVDDHPFTRPLGDLNILLHRVRLAPSGEPAPPATRAFWSIAFDVDADVTSDTGALPGGASGLVDAAWLVGATGGADMYSRTDRLDQFSFAQRVFDGGGTGEQAVAVVHSFRQYRMLMLTLERMGMRSPALYEALWRRAATVTLSGSSRRFWVLAQFQGAIALVARMRRVGTIDESTSAALLSSLAGVQLVDGEFDGGVAAWMRGVLVRSVPGEGPWDARLLLAMSGPIADATTPRLFWEGQTYRLDLPLAERERLEVVRRKQGGHTADVALAIDAVARRLRKPSITLDDVRSATGVLREIASESGARLRNPSVLMPPASVDVSRDPLEWLESAASDLAKMTRDTDLRRAARTGFSLNQLADVVLGNALVSLAYAADIGDPEGSALLAGNVALRHDFGFGRRDSDIRARTAWAIPRQDFQPGVPWHVSGSLLGLDIALAPLNLRRLTIERIADAPTLSSLERESLASAVSLMDPSRMTNRDRDALASAVDRGRARLAATTDEAALNGVADLLGFDGWRRRTARWALRNAPEQLAGQFSLVDLVTLGGEADAADLDAWGVPGLYSEGCACLRFPTPRSWRILRGRPQLPMMAATMGDLNVAVALEFRELNLPAPLVRPALSVGMQDFIDETVMASAYDWWTLSRNARGLRRQRVEDYVAVAAAVDGPLIPEDAASREP